MAERTTAIANLFITLWMMGIFFACAATAESISDHTSSDASHAGAFQTSRWLRRTTGSLDRKRTVVASGTELRILPLGDSITYGYQSTPDGNNGNGYRYKLQQDLAGSQLLFIGSVQSGNMNNNQNEGHPGATISQIQGFAANSLPERPNIVLIHAGTNDLHASNPTNPYASAPDRLALLINAVISACPDATILVAQIIHNSDSATDSRIQTFNSKIPGLVSTATTNGHKNIAAVDFSSVTSNLLNDGTHPSDAGYQKMGDIWFAAIQKAASNGWIKAPIGLDPGNQRQECTTGLFWYQAIGGAQVASGFGKGGNGTRFADIDGDGIDDYLFIDDNGALTAYVNGGPNSANTGWNWYPQGLNGVITGGAGAPRAQIQLADINGDGRADYLIVNQQSGAVTAYLNGGKNPNDATQWVWLPQNQIASGIGRDGAGVRFADIDGDGKADYCWVGPNGELEVYINVFGENPSNFIPYNNGNFIANGIGGTRAETRLADINGDGRADYIRIESNGAMDLYTNEVGKNPAFFVPQPQAASGVGAPGPTIQFGILTKSGRADYIPVTPSSGAIYPWLNGCK